MSQSHLLHDLNMILSHLSDTPVSSQWDSGFITMGLQFHQHGTGVPHQMGRNIACRLTTQRFCCGATRRCTRQEEALNTSGRG